MRVSDEEYLFRKDIKEKKAAGRGAFHRKCGSKSKKCTLPHERLTKKELAAMNGEVISYDPRAWYTWEEFKKIPIDLQVRYVNSIMTRYDCSLSAISTIVFGLESTSLNLYFKRLGQTEYLNSHGKKGGNSKLWKPGREKLKADVEAARAIQNGSNVINDVEEAKEDEPYESPQSQIKKSIADAIDMVTLYATNGVPMPLKRLTRSS